MTGTASPAIATRLEKMAVDNGFDLELPREGAWLGFASTQTPLRIGSPRRMTCSARRPCRSPRSRPVLRSSVKSSVRGFPRACRRPSRGRLRGMHRMVDRAFHLSRTLPDALLRDFERRISGLPRATEIERVVIQRVGQEVFREGLLSTWQGRCAVTGLGVPELLRASHIKPWAACDTDAERLDVFNGLLLAPHLDALFDCGFITVTDLGDVHVSEALSNEHRAVLGLQAPLSVKGLAAGHRPYLAFHRAIVFRAATV